MCCSLVSVQGWSCVVTNTSSSCQSSGVVWRKSGSELYVQFKSPSKQEDSGIAKVGKRRWRRRKRERRVRRRR